MPDTTAVSVKNVSKQFDNIEVLRDINLTVEKGSVVSILGSSGSGKSTLRCMNWLEQPDRGEIRIGGQRLGIDEQNGRHVPSPAVENPRAGGDGVPEL
jgi:polar amino acid transport system ATP-binding protein